MSLDFFTLAFDDADQAAREWLMAPSADEMRPVDPAFVQALDDEPPSQALADFLSQKIQELRAGKIVSTAARHDGAFALAFAQACARSLRGHDLERAYQAFQAHIAGSSVACLALAMALHDPSPDPHRAWRTLFIRSAYEFNRPESKALCLALSRKGPAPSNFLPELLEAGVSLDALEGAFDAIGPDLARDPDLPKTIDALARQSNDPADACGLFKRAIDAGMDPGPAHRLISPLAALACEREAALMSQGLAAPQPAARQPRL